MFKQIKCRSMQNVPQENMYINCVICKTHMWISSTWNMVAGFAKGLMRQTAAASKD